MLWRKTLGIVEKKGSTEIWLGLLAMSLLIFLTARNAGMYPSVFADEWFYNLFSRHYNIEFSQRPSYLYFMLYGITNQCGDGFLECATLINILFFVAAIPLIYSIARKYLNKKWGLFVTALSVFSPINSYSAYFMPESMYFFGFFLFTWITLKGHEKMPWLMVFFAGAALACMSMVKVHAIFLFIGLLAVLISSWFSDRSLKVARNVVLYSLASIFSFLVVRLTLGYLIAGKAGLNVLGQDYANTANSANGIAKALQLLPLIGYNLWGNLMAVAIIFGLPLALLLNIPLNTIWVRSTKQCNLNVLKLYLASLLFSLMLITALFFASVQGTGPYESISRLSLRYYDFLFPLMLITAATGIKSKVQQESRSIKMTILFLMVSILAIYALATQLKGYTPGLADCPELRAFTYNIHVFLLLGGMGVLCLILGMFRIHWGATLYMLVFMPLTTIASTYFINKEMRLRLIPDVYDQAGQFTQRYLGANTAKLAIIGADLSSIFRTHFYMKTQTTTFINLANGQNIPKDSIPEDKEWLLLIGDYKQPFAVEMSIKVPVTYLNKVAEDTSVVSYSLVRIHLPLTIDFSQNIDPKFFTMMTGLSIPETIGRWSDGDKIQLEFTKKLPSSFELTIDALAFGPNVGRSFELYIGDQKYSFVLGSNSSTVRIIVDVVGETNTMIIKVPSPTSPIENGLNSDKRKLGLALKKISIRELNKSTW